MPLRLLCIGLLLLLPHAPASAQSAAGRLSGETLYLPVYSHIWHGDLDSRGLPVKTLLSVLVSIRNTDPVNAIRILSARYFNSEGKEIREYVPKAVSIAPLGTHELFVSRDDDTGGSGANFVIAWNAPAPASPPIVEAVHANLPAGRAVIFVTTARPIPR